MYVIVNNKYYLLYERKDESQYYNKDGKRINLRSNQKTASSKDSITSQRKSSLKKIASKKKCPTGQIQNPKTGRCVKRSGKIGMSF